jgi:hypothetical protein
MVTDVTNLDMSLGVLRFQARAHRPGDRFGGNFGLWPILLQKSATSDLAVGPCVESCALKRWP